MRPSSIAAQAPQRATPPRILIVDDREADACELGNAVSRYGYDLKVVRNSFIALDIAKQWKPQVAILDVKMPGMDGLTLSEKLRKYANDPIVIFVTSEATNKMRRLCLNAGDDYITKPYSDEDLFLRVQSKLRRSDPNRGNEQGSGAETRRAPVAFEARASWEDVFTPTELRLLNALIAGEGEMVSRVRLLRDVWDDEVYDNTLDRTIRRLRMKIEPEPRRPRIIITVRKGGYRINLAAWRRARDDGPR